MNYKLIAFTIICFILLSGCLSASQDTPQSTINVGVSGVPADTQLKITKNQPVVSQEAGKSSLSIIDLYEKWNGVLICNYNSYTPGSTVYYSEEYVECEIQFSSQDGLNTTTDDLRMLEANYITVENELMKESKERFDYIDFTASADIPNIIKMRIHPSRETLKIIFKSKKENKPIAFNFVYAEPLTYTISRPFDADAKLYAIGIRQYLQTEASHIYNIPFPRL